MSLYPPFALLLRHSGAVVTAGTRSYDEQTTAFLRDGGARAGCSPQNFGIGAVCEVPVTFPGIVNDGTLVSIDLAPASLTLPMLRAIFERRGRYDMRAGLADVFAHLDRFAPWGGL